MPSTKPRNGSSTPHVEIKKTNSLAVAGFILSFILPPLGLIFSIIGLVKAKKFNGDGKTLSIIGIIVSIFMSLMMLFIVIVLVAASFASINQKAEEATQKTKINISQHSAALPEKLELGDTYNEKTGIFSITLPKGWKEIQSENGWYVSTGLPSTSGSYVATTSISVDKLRANENFIQFMATETDRITKEDNGKIINQSAITINSLSGHELAVRKNTYGTLWSHYIVILNKTDSIYLLDYRTSPDHMEAYLPTFKVSAQSFVAN